MPSNGRPEGWIDFEEVKQTVPFDVVLSKLDVMNQLRRVGDEIRGKCPICGGERSFSANPVKGMYNCFRCKKGGDVISFVAAHQKIEKRQAAVWLVSLMPPAEEGTLDQEAEVVTALSSMGLTDREVRLLQLMTRAHARYISAMFSCFFASAAEQLEQDAWEAVKEEIIREFPDTLFPAEEM